MNQAAIFIIRFFSKLFKYNGLRACRFSPTCSEYSSEAFLKRGFFAASWLTLKRLCRCHPFSAGGWDPLERE